MSLEERMAEALGKKSAETETPSNQNNNGSEETKNTTLEQVIDSTGQNDHDDEEKQVKTSNPKDSAIINLKRQLREQKQEITEARELLQELTTLVQKDAKTKLSQAKINALAEKTGTDPDAIRELADLIREEVAPPKEDKTSKASKRQAEHDDYEEEDEKPKVKLDRARLVQGVNALVDNFMQEMPEYQDVFDGEDLKEIILSNPNKYSSMPIIEIVEKFYGKAVKGKKGIESMKPSGSSHQEKKVGGRLSSREFKEIKDDPEAMKDYKADLLSRVRKAGLF